MIRSFIKAGFDTPINSRVIAALSLTKFIPYPSDIKDMLIYYNAYVGGYPPYLPEGQLKADILSIKGLHEETFRQKFFELHTCIDEDDELYKSFNGTLKCQPDMVPSIILLRRFYYIWKKLKIA